MPAFHSLRVAAIDPLTDDAVALTFEVPEELRDEYVFTAGQHLSIRGADEKRRSFSIFTPPSSGLLRVGIKVLPGGSFSEGVLGDLRVGDELDVMTPAGRFTVSPDADAKHRYVAIAAGLGHHAGALDHHHACWRRSRPPRSRSSTRTGPTAR